MKGDFTRVTFDRKKHYTGVLKQQGRVDLDADWNEYVAIQTYLDQTEARDVIGSCGVPKHGGGFKIGVKTDGSDLTISQGRIYVDGILCEMEDAVTYLTQGDYLKPPALTQKENRTDLVYLDVWRRHVTAIEEPGIREVALGGPDTTTRVKTVWQVKVKEDVLAGHCGNITAWPPAPGKGYLSTDVIPTSPSDDPCLIAPDTGYRGLENRLYRVEIHESGDLGKATFKWSRDNGSIAFAIEEFVSSDTVKVKRLKRDQVLALREGDWVEVLDDVAELQGKPGTLAKIDDIDEAKRTITLSASVSGYDVKRHAKVRRWDQGSDAILTATGPITLEDGIQIAFSGSDFRTGDYWVFAARTATKKVEKLDKALPHGIAHHYCSLALITWKKGTSGATTDWQPKIRDCRRIFPPLTEVRGNCCTVTVGDGVYSHGQYDDIQEAVDNLPPRGGRVCILPGDYRLKKPVRVKSASNVAISGCQPHTWLHMKAGGGAFVVVESTDVRLENLGFRLEDSAKAIVARKSGGVELQHNLIIAASSATASDLVVIDTCTQVNVSQNKLRGGGIRVLAGSSDIAIEQNVIADGIGHGIAFGPSTSDTSEGQGDEAVATTEESSLSRSEERLGEDVASTERETTRTVEETEAAQQRPTATTIKHVTIKGNTISSMKGSGIAMSVQPDADIPSSLITTDYLTIKGNDILACGQGASQDDGSSVQGGIILAGGKQLHIRDNRIEGCRPADIKTSTETDASETPSSPTVTPDLVPTIPETRLETDITATLGETPVSEGTFEFSLSRSDTLASGATILERPGLAAEIRYTETFLDVEETEVSAAPIAGIYILQSEGLEISHNRIINNGSPKVGTQAAGRQGGIIVKQASIQPFQMRVSESVTFTFSNGYPAAKVHCNNVIVPRGPALQIAGIGPMAITDNQLTSQGTFPLPEAEEGTDERQTTPDLQSIGAVQVVNLGIADELAGYFPGFQQLHAAHQTIGGETLPAPDTSAAEVRFDGSVLFSDNQVTLNLARPEQELVHASVLIVSLDDVAFHDNQLDAVLPAKDVLFANAVVLGVRSRASGNVFKETLTRCYFSYASAALLNMATDNQGNHCFFVYGLDTSKLVAQNNIALACKLGDVDFPRLVVGTTPSESAAAETISPDAQNAAQAYREILVSTDAYRPALLKEFGTVQDAKVKNLQAEKESLTTQPGAEDWQITTVSRELAVANVVNARIDTLVTFEENLP